MKNTSGLQKIWKPGYNLTITDNLYTPEKQGRGNLYAESIFRIKSKLWILSITRKAVLVGLLRKNIFGKFKGIAMLSENHSPALSSASIPNGAGRANASDNKDLFNLSSSLFVVNPARGVFLIPFRATSSYGWQATGKKLLFNLISNRHYLFR